MEANITETFFCQILSELLIVGTIQNSTWLPEPIKQFDWLSLKTYYLMIGNFIWCEWNRGDSLQCEPIGNPRWLPPQDLVVWTQTVHEWLYGGLLQWSLLCWSEIQGSFHFRTNFTAIMDGMLLGESLDNNLFLGFFLYVYFEIPRWLPLQANILANDLLGKSKYHFFWENKNLIKPKLYIIVWFHTEFSCGSKMKVSSNHRQVV